MIPLFIRTQFALILFAALMSAMGLSAQDTAEKSTAAVANPPNNQSATKPADPMTTTVRIRVRDDQDIAGTIIDSDGHSATILTFFRTLDVGENVSVVRQPQPEKDFVEDYVGRVIASNGPSGLVLLKIETDKVLPRSPLSISDLPFADPPTPLVTVSRDLHGRMTRTEVTRDLAKESQGPGPRVIACTVGPGNIYPGCGLFQDGRLQGVHMGPIGDTALFLSMNTIYEFLKTTQLSTLVPVDDEAQAGPASSIALGTTGNNSQPNSLEPRNFPYPAIVVVDTEQVRNGPGKKLKLTKSCNLKIVQGNSVLVETEENVQRMHIADESVAKVVQYSPREFSIVGLHRGSTTVTLWVLDQEPFSDSRPLILSVGVVNDTETTDEASGETWLQIIDKTTATQLIQKIVQDEATLSKQHREMQTMSSQLGAEHPTVVRSRQELDEATKILQQMKDRVEELKSKHRREIKTFKVSRGNATEYAALLKPFYRNVLIVADPRSNCVVASGGQEDLTEIVTVLMRLENSNDQETVAAGTGTANKGSTVVPAESPSPKQSPDRIAIGIAEHEEKARRLADQILQLPAKPGQTDAARTKLRRDLEKTLADALELKFQQEQSQLNDLEKRLSRMRTQYQFRRAASKKILDRRLRDLLERDEFKWDTPKPESASPAPAMAHAEIQGSEPVSRARNEPKSKPAIKPDRPIVIVEGSYDDLSFSNWKAFDQFNRLTERISGMSLKLTQRFPKDRDGHVGLSIKRGSDRLPIDTGEMTPDEIRVRARIDVALYLSGIRSILWSPQIPSRAETIAARNPVAAGGTGPVREPEFRSSALIEMAEAKVRRLEATYFQTGSGTDELRKALSELSEARQELLTEWKDLLHKASTEWLDEKYANAVTFAESRVSQLENLGKTHPEQNISRQIESSKREVENARAAVAQIEAQYQWIARLIESGSEPRTNEFDEKSFLPPLTETLPDYYLDGPLEWIEWATELKCDFVPLHDVGLNFAAALRVREKSKWFDEGDLIFALNGHLFDTLEQAICAMKETESGNVPSTTTLVGGLSGKRLFRNVPTWRPGPEMSAPGPVSKSEVQFELRLVTPNGGKVETKYIQGICVSPAGLVVIPYSTEELAPNSPIVSFGNFKGTARVVATDRESGLTLLKLDVKENRWLFPWGKCRTVEPTMNQRLLRPQNGNALAPIVKIGVSMPQRDAIKDFFVVQVSDETSVGAPLVSVDDELQGIVVDSILTDPETRVTTAFAIPASHIQKLLDNYRKTLRAAQTDRSDPLGLRLQNTEPKHEASKQSTTELDENGLPANPFAAKAQADVLAAAEASLESEEILREWEARSSLIKTIHGKHTRTVYNAVSEVEAIAEGKFYFELPGKWRIDSVGIVPKKDEKSARIGRSGDPFRLKADHAEKRIFDGKGLFTVNDDEKTYSVIPIPEDTQGNHIFSHPLPFLPGTKANDIKNRYRIKLKKNDKAIAILILYPLQKIDQEIYSETWVILDKSTYLPSAVKLVDPTANLETVYKFTSVAVNLSNTGDPFHPNFKKEGYKLVLHPDPDANSPSRNRIWKALGLRLGPAVSSKTLGSNRYRGGLQVTEVAKRPAGSSGIERGDILVGLDKWETVSLDHVSWILSHQKPAAEGEPAQSVKYFAIRNGKTISGTLSLIRIERSTEGTAMENVAPTILSQSPEHLFVIGLVRKPDKYFFPKTGEIRVTDAIAMADGTLSSVSNKILVLRRSPGKTEPDVIRVNLEEAKQKAEANILLEPGDVVSVEDTASAVIVDAFHMAREGSVEATNSLKSLADRAVAVFSDATAPKPQSGTRPAKVDVGSSPMEPQNGKPDETIPVPAGLPINDNSNAKANEELESFIWDTVQLFLDPIVEGKKLPPKFRAGLMIRDVSRTLFDKGVWPGDVILGVDKWETLTREDVAYAIQNAQYDSPSLPKSMTLYRSREGKVHVTTISFKATKSTFSPDEAIKQPELMSVDAWIDVLQRNRDPKTVPELARVIAKVCDKSNSERAASAILAAADLTNFTDDYHLLSQTQKVFTLMKPEATIRAFVRALQDGSPKVKYVALVCIGQLMGFAPSPEFPALAEQILKFAAADDPIPRNAALFMLAETIPITKLNPADVSTEERQTMVKRLAEHLPTKRVIELLLAALNAPQTDVAYRTANLLMKLPEESKDPDIHANITKVLVAIANGSKPHDSVSRGLRIEAFECLARLFQRSTLQLAKAMFPSVKAALQQFRKKESEDALFNGQKADSQLPESILIFENTLESWRQAAGVPSSY